MVTNLFNIVVVAILARKLEASDFGLVAMASVVLRLLTTLGPVGVGSYIIYDKQDGREQRVNSAFWLNLMLAASGAAVCLLMVPFVSAFYKTPELKPVLAVLILQFTVAQLVSVPDALLQRSMKFKALAVRETVLEVLKGAGMVGMALSGYGVWSLVLPGTLLTPIAILIGFKLAGWLPSLPVRTFFWPAIFRYSCHTTGASLVTFLSNEGDNLIIGKRLGAADLGFYAQAFGASQLVRRNVSGVVGKVAMPALSKVAGDLARLRAALSRMLRMLALTSFPLLIGLLVVADLFVLTLYGPKWQASVLPLQILIFFSLRHAVGSPANMIYYVLGKPQIDFKQGLIFLPFYLASVWIGSSYGIVGVAAAVTISRTVFGVYQFAVVGRLINQTLRGMLAPMAQPLVASVLMGLGVLCFRLLLSGLNIPKPLLLIILVGLGGLLWLGLLLRVFPKAMNEMLLVCDAVSLTFGNRIRRTLSPMMPAEATNAGT